MFRLPTQTANISVYHLSKLINYLISDGLFHATADLDQVF